jgi:hypothetical protein
LVLLNLPKISSTPVVWRGCYSENILCQLCPVIASHFPCDIEGENLKLHHFKVILILTKLEEQIPVCKWRIIFKDAEDSLTIFSLCAILTYKEFSKRNIIFLKFMTRLFTSKGGCAEWIFHENVLCKPKVCKNTNSLREKWEVKLHYKRSNYDKAVLFFRRQRSIREKTKNLRPSQYKLVTG